MIRITRDGKQIDIDTYSNIGHLRNIGKHLRILGHNMIHVEDLRKAINKEIIMIQDSMAEQFAAYLYSLD